MTRSTILKDEKYRVHELLRPEELPTPSHWELLNSSELPGEDIRCDEDGAWVDFCVEPTFKVSATDIVHRGKYLPRNGLNGHQKLQEGPGCLPPSATAPCFGFIFQERPEMHDPPRKIVVLGDTSDPSSITKQASQADVLIHESTLAHIVLGDPNNPKNDPKNITEKAISRGHSTAEMAGLFAGKVDARILALNHFSAR